MFSSNRLFVGLMLAALVISACRPVQARSPEETLSAHKELRPDAPPYAARGPFGVGYRSLISGEGTTRPLEVSIWYPTLISTGDKEEAGYEVKLKWATWLPITPPIVYGQSILNAAPDASKKPYPLVILSHGFSLSAGWYAALAEHYASYGFIVLAPEHTEQLDPFLGDMWKSVIDRPVDAKQTLDYAEELTAPGGDMAGLIDMEHVAVVGHSYGGYTALAMAGAQYDLAAYNARCAQLPENDSLLPLFCTPLVPKEADMASRAGFDLMPEGLWPSFGDPRVTAIISMAGDAYLFDKAGLSKITIPMMAMGGTADSGTPYEWGARLAYDHVSSEQKALVGFVGAEHMIFSPLCENQPWLSNHPFYEDMCFEPVWDRDRALDLIYHFSTAFLLDTLRGDQAAHEALLPEAVHFPGIDYTTTLK